MAKLYVTEYAGMGWAHSQTAIAPPIVEQTPVVIGAGSLKSAAFDAATTVVRIHTDAICSIAFGTDPTATANHQRMAADTTEYFSVKFGHKVAVITNT
jgi:hypothetical protein